MLNKKPNGHTCSSLDFPHPISFLEPDTSSMKISPLFNLYSLTFFVSGMSTFYLKDIHL